MTPPEKIREGSFFAGSQNNERKKRKISFFCSCFQVGGQKTERKKRTYTYMRILEFWPPPKEGGQRNEHKNGLQSTFLTPLGQKFSGLSGGSVCVCVCVCVVTPQKNDPSPNIGEWVCLRYEYLHIPRKHAFLISENILTKFSFCSQNPSNPFNFIWFANFFTLASLAQKFKALQTHNKS